MRVSRHNRSCGIADGVDNVQDVADLRTEARHSDNKLPDECLGSNCSCQESILASSDHSTEWDDSQGRVGGGTVMDFSKMDVVDESTSRAGVVMGKRVWR